MNHLASVKEIQSLDFRHVELLSYELEEYYKEQEDKQKRGY